MVFKKKTQKLDPQSVTDPRYTLNELKAKSEVLFGVKPEVLAGACYGTEDQLLSVEEAGTKITKFMKAKVE
ncbi:MULTISPECIES: hypothetical protein [Paenibacillus]|uniref:hypothetical protein n=1 Tax=Paenibacillus TaxID=44249 RepID=UPI0003A89EE6|nr:hypothetical protein [Paenibacillus massiliensis]